MSNARTFEELTVEEQDIAIGILHDEVLLNALTRKMLPLDNKLANDACKATEGRGITTRLDDWAWDIAGAIAADCIFLPDDGSKVVRL